MIKATVLSKLSKLSEHSKCSECQLKLVATEIGIEHDDYLQQIFRGGTSSIAWSDFIFQTLSIIDFMSLTIKTIMGAVIFNAGYQGGRNLPGVRKLQLLGFRGMKSKGPPRPGCEDLINNS